MSNDTNTISLALANVLNLVASFCATEREQYLITLAIAHLVIVVARTLDT